MTLIDMHLHLANRSPCSRLTLEELNVHLSPRIGAIYITDHDVMIPITETGWRFQTFLGIEIECRIHEYGYPERAHFGIRNGIYRDGNALCKRCA